MITLPTRYYRQFDADYSLDVPGEGYGGWDVADLPLEPEHTALVVMHAWDCGTREQYPGWHRAIEYIPRSQAICETVFPDLLAAARRSTLPILHVVGGGDYYKDLPGYRHALELAGPPAPAPEVVGQTEGYSALQRFRSDSTGVHNKPDIQRGFARVDFAPQARPVGDEGVAENGHQLLALCREREINHLVYVGFAINWCLLLSPGGMAEMTRHGLICSTIPEAVTAVENRETARREWSKENALWRVALAFGFVYDLDDFLQALARCPA